MSNYTMITLDDGSRALVHHGILGQKWGIRRFQNPDGTLTEAGKKRVSKIYEKNSKKAAEDLSKNYNKMWLNAYNNAANEMNSGKIDKFNNDQEKKYGKNFADRDEYYDDYEKYFDTIYQKYWKEEVTSFTKTNKYIKLADELMDKYKIWEFNDHARQEYEDRKSFYEK